MYKQFFGMSRDPFELTPDPTCFISTDKHDEALATLYYGVRRHKGFVVVTGEVGTGKTLLLRCLLELLSDSRDISYSYVFNSRLGPFDFLQYMMADFGLPVTGKSKSELLLTFTEFLTSRGSRGLTTVLVIDEAHDLSEDILEEIRLLSNIETTKEKLLQILLIGQPELDAKLDTQELRQLKQRIALRARLGALNMQETASYIARRLEIAGIDPKSQGIFSQDAIEEVFRYSNGIPRLINTICENSLVSAYARQSHVITREIVRSIAENFRLGNDVESQSMTLTPEDSMRERMALDFSSRLHNTSSRDQGASATKSKREAL